ncbi:MULTISPECIES: GDSL-type esterase/lipase family protein [Okeania]|uniref:G-D-S-L family lipolytic protein n=1 Tax=Okeania hirsuta TaxID=1458930 RepID=A0A3N6RD36_9CYAN|nr:MULTISPECIES: GDSL-type esterase/lipase family protein [Okeania]NES79879.1 G-D-S-L family lipolytic protein [Okeania sp. SIO1H4]NES90796.1 G-D-S-L family lipolytic protein [Okeania sp. SIO2B9]NET23683.1 G-D-S-L family lipolytic protein [Okeania sp. SIO1H5]NET77591.1 G-D-S-L family lipolytic protein [Okeania sp. SIO1F9]NET97392.1 G-D-S-L family lipolytic protein [Okeania sp. SIO1H2]
MLLATPSTVKRFSQTHHHPLKIVALGDSLVYGFGDYEGGGWVERLRRQWMLPDSPGHVLYNLGVRGNRVLQVEQRLEHEFRHRGELRNRQPDIIILSVGVNDSARVQRPDGRYYTDFSKFKTILDNLLDTSKQLCPVLFVGMVPVNLDKMPFQDCLYYSHEDQFIYKEATRLACLKRKIPYLDVFEKWLSRGENWWRLRLCPDGIHPNVAGYKALLQDVLDWEYLNLLTS